MEFKLCHVTYPLICTTSGRRLREQFHTKSKWTTAMVVHEIEVDAPIRNLSILKTPMSGIVDTSYKFDFVGANPGGWRVRAVDKEGHEGFASSWRRFVYLQ